MAVFLLLLFLFPFLEAQAQIKDFNISIGSSLSPTSNSSWLSPSKLYAFGFYEEGDGFAVGIFVAGIPEKTVVWTAKRDEDHIVSSNATLLLTTDGRLILQDEGNEIDVANTDSIASASMLNNGNFVLYSSDQNITWQSFDHPTDTILPGQSLTAGQQLVSRLSENDYSMGIFRLKMQSDGNLVQYPLDSDDTRTYAYYATGTDTYGNKVTLNLENDGHLFLLNSTVNIKNLTSGGNTKQRTIYRMRVDVDGIFRVYSYSLDNKGNWTAVWSSTTDGCAPKGRCGLNQFCVLMDQDVHCRCLPGFDNINKGDQSSGCERNFTSASCKDNNQSVAYYTMKRSENIAWENNPYATLMTNSAEDCEQKCLEDCNCDAALFNDHQCEKQRLPLRFGRTTQDSTVTLIKVGLPAFSGNGVTIREKTKVHTHLLIVSISLIATSLLVLTIAGIVFHRSRQWAYTVKN